LSPTKATSHPCPSRSNDTRLLVAGVAAFLALVAYLAVAFATTRNSPTAAVNVATVRSKVGPWTGRASSLARVRGAGASKGGLTLRVTPVGAGLYGVEIKKLFIPRPLRHAFAFSVQVRARRPSRILVQINHGSASPRGYLVSRTVVVGRKWRRLTYRIGLGGGGNGIGPFFGQTTQGDAKRWFEIRGLSVRASRG
jgi:hypothetical protein